MQFNIIWKKILNNKKFNVFESCGINNNEMIEIY